MSFCSSGDFCNPKAVIYKSPPMVLDIALGMITLFLGVLGVLGVEICLGVKVL